MYNAKAIIETGEEFDFGYEHGVLFDIDLLSGIDVQISSSQGFNQIGQTVDGQSVGGVYRTLSGIVLSDNIAKKMISAFGVFTKGKLYINNNFFFEFFVNKTPQVSRSKSGKLTFIMRLFCPSPFFEEKDISSFVISGFTKSFSFPVMYNSHRFSYTNKNAFVNCKNKGDVYSPFVCRFTSNADVTNYGIIDVKTLSVLQFQDTLRIGEEVSVFTENGIIKAEKKTESNKISVISKITDESNLFGVSKGDNIIKSTAENGLDHLTTIISFRPKYMGVLV